VTISAFTEQPARLAEILFTTTDRGNVAKLTVEKKADVVRRWLSTDVPVVRQHRTGRQTFAVALTGW
jgi:hypothetical protein